MEELGIKLTEAQIERQLKKMKVLLFEDYEEYDDGSYKGDVVEEVIDIIEKHIPNEPKITQMELLRCIQMCAVDIFDWVESQLKGVDKRLMALYCFDFTNQSFNTIYSFEISDDITDDNPMYS